MPQHGLVALARVAQAAANLRASTFPEATGVEDSEGLTQAEGARLGWAVEELLRRLDAITDRNDPETSATGVGDVSDLITPRGPCSRHPTAGHEPGPLTGWI